MSSNLRISNDDHIDRSFVNCLAEIEKRYLVLPKPLRIRTEKWLEKLAAAGNNLTWRKQRNAYVVLLLNMVISRNFTEPFHISPPDGPLQSFPTHTKSRSRNILGPHEASFWRELYYKIGDDACDTRDSSRLDAPSMPIANDALRETPTEIRNLNLLVKEQTQRIQLLELQLHEERMKHELQLQRLQFTQRIELKKLHSQLLNSSNTSASFDYSAANHHNENIQYSNDNNHGGEFVHPPRSGTPVSSQFTPRDERPVVGDYSMNRGVAVREFDEALTNHRNHPPPQQQQSKHATSVQRTMMPGHQPQYHQQLQRQKYMADVGLDSFAPAEPLSDASMHSIGLDYTYSHPHSRLGESSLHTAIDNDSSTFGDPSQPFQQLRQNGQFTVEQLQTSQAAPPTQHQQQQYLEQHREQLLQSQQQQPQQLYNLFTTEEEQSFRDITPHPVAAAAASSASSSRQHSGNDVSERNVINHNGVHKNNHNNDDDDEFLAYINKFQSDIKSLSQPTSLSQDMQQLQQQQFSSATLQQHRANVGSPPKIRSPFAAEYLVSD